MMRPFPYDREVYSGNWTEAGLVDNLLKADGIDTVVALPKGGSRALRSIYVLEAADLERARAIVDRFIRGEPMSDPKKIRSWRCPSCNELIEGQFQACWKCGRLRASRGL